MTRHGPRTRAVLDIVARVTRRLEEESRRLERLVDTDPSVLDAEGDRLRVFAESIRDETTRLKDATAAASQAWRKRKEQPAPDWPDRWKRFERARQLYLKAVERLAGQQTAATEN